MTINQRSITTYTELTASMRTDPAALPRSRGSAPADVIGTASRTAASRDEADPMSSVAGDGHAASEDHVGAKAADRTSTVLPVEAALCATYPAWMEWVPDRERRVVPDLMTALCRRCLGRQRCLLGAMAGGEQGYWAGTTSTDRELMRQLGRDNVDTADWLQNLARREFTDGALHPAGEGSYFWYRRRGCRCGECKAANAETRAQERAKAKDLAA